MSQQGVRAAIDVSDGLLADLAHICEASQVNATVKETSVPIHPALKANFKTDCRRLALAGGEDYELLFAASSEVITQVKKAISCPITVIGEVTKGVPGQVTLVDGVGRNIPWERGGWEHFKSEALAPK